MSLNINESKRINYFLYTAILVGIIAAIAVWKPTVLTGVIIAASNFFYQAFDWLIMWLPLLALIVCLTVAFSRYGNIRLGGKEAKPEYSFLTWMNMLFTAGIGVGIVFYGPIEGLWHYYQSSIGVKDTSLATYEQVGNAMSLALHVWGLPAWALYTLAGIVMAYFAYQHKMEFSPAAPLQKAFPKKRWVKPVGIIITALAIISIALSVSSSVAMATGQIGSGLEIITGISFASLGWKTIILIVITALYTLGAILPIAKGMTFLGNMTVYLSLALLTFVFVVGPSHYFLSTMVVAVGNIATQTIPHSFELYLFEPRDWIVWYPMAYWVWWVTWAPFVGVFLAKISYGRTVRQFVLASILVPTGFIVIWFSVFSGFSLLDTIEGSGKLAEIANKGDYEGTFYYLLEMLPGSAVTKVVTVILFLGFVVTTVTSAAISLGIMTSHDGRTESRYKAVVWSVLIALVAYAVVVTGKIEGIKAVGSFAGFPFVFLTYLWMAALRRQLRRDYPTEKKEL
ncbi:BCCT family transporter [Psychrobacter sp. FDAARGOS_221]|uniref:BCCT family transporter n=1 Tax=Psychrobacter sp. FDAARGOS_221 TaxID=1975705 RepID=UPI000BB58723|nr:BCCT family transporter [Psychrobacter sp. FDAARGOS_221]PNK61956.1 glycine/betaine ABC transporter [Psychrobacter sp. FDAARGOS_221]